MEILYQKQLDFYLATGRYLEYPSHIHSHCEIQFIRSGKLDATIDGKHYTVCENEMLFVMPYQIHSFVSKYPNESDTMFISPSHLGIFAEKLPKNPVISLGTPEKEEMCKSIVEYIFNTFGSKPIPGVSLRRTEPDARQNTVAIQLAKAYLNIAMDCAEWVPREITAHDTTRKVLEFCIKNYSEDISLAKIAEEIGVSAHTVSRVFSSVSGNGFRQYINSLRLSEASELLAFTDWSIKTIAEKCGFGTQRTFNRVFMSEKGMTPLNYRIMSRIKDKK